MRVKDVYLSKLYGIYNHHIYLDNDGLTIIHGPNGVGKTAVLKCLKFILDWDLVALSKIPFRLCRIEMDNGLVITAQRQSKLAENKTGVFTGAVDVTFQRPDGSIEHAQGLDTKMLEFSESVAESKPWLSKLKKGLWRDVRDGTLVEAHDVIAEYLPGAKKKKRANSAYFDSVRNTLSVKIIDTHRLSGLASEANGGAKILECVSDMVKQIKIVNAEYAKRAQELDQTFPHRLIMENQATYSTAEVKQRLLRFETRQSQLSTIGLLASLEGPVLPSDIDALSDAKLEAISLFVQDSEKKLDSFNELAIRCSALLKLIENKFTNKKLAIRKDEGLVVLDSFNGHPIPIEALSSGEQHEIVITYELLFKTPANTLLLIDEPEISLHVAWQKTFIEDLKYMSSIVGFDALVATHSPFIVGDHYEIMQALDDGDRGE
ncbi:MULTISPECIES: AAA family ATPase [unclassified Pseudomonas]|uniref:AAA family ATPase n=1 Tax=unclassified Pseudomonas TaxID=196821 RepID=UPI000A1D67D1|nr:MULTISPECIES: AAA family ATPase [unclassified Pseudomonas]